jgi:hypothetical protein
MPWVANCNGCWHSQQRLRIDNIVVFRDRLRAYPHRAILFVILNLGSAQNPHVLRVRSGFSALSASKLTATITPMGIGFEKGQ